ncbi:MAG TPA: phosphoserine phosphatase SerB [Thauera sp.]|nr:phosphoserine phosphatase SerB [Thauera sp.]HRA79895.1 phosphoserine phosphatase SerB [Thauera sp.]
MNLVVFAEDVDSIVLKNVAKLTGARAIEQITPRSFRLIAAQAHPDLAKICAAGGLDHAWLSAGRQLRDFGLFVTDMDSTLINIECIDEIADMQGLKAEVAEITEAAMEGRIDFRESLTRRVSLLAGLSEQALGEVFTHRLQLNPGAERLMKGLQRAGLRTVLVSGGFTYFTERLKQQLGFDHAFANELEVVDGHLTGRIVGEVVDGAAKARHLLRIRDKLGLAAEQVIAAGDGANDIQMLEAAGFSVAFHPKPVLRQVVDCCIEHSGLDGVLDLFD